MMLSLKRFLILVIYTPLKNSFALCMEFTQEFSEWKEMVKNSVLTHQSVTFSIIMVFIQQLHGSGVIMRMEKVAKLSTLLKISPKETLLIFRMVKKPIIFCSTSMDLSSQKEQRKKQSMLALWVLCKVIHYLI